MRFRWLLPALLVGMNYAGPVPATAREIAIAGGDMPALTSALGSAVAGDVFRLAPGVYRGEVTIGRSVTVVGAAGVVFDPSERLQLSWHAAPDVGPGVFRATTDRRPATLFLDGRVLAEIDEKRTQAEGGWNWRTVLAHGGPRSGFTFIRAVWIYRSDEHAVYLHLPADADPAAAKLSVTWNRKAIVTFSGATNASLRDVTLRQGYQGVLLTEGSRDCTVAGCTITNWDKTGVALQGGAAHNRVEKNEITRGAYEDWDPSDRSRERYEVWQLHKLAGFYDRVGVSLVRAGAGNRVMANHVFLTFDGIDLGDSSIESLDKPMPHPDDGRDTEIAGNTIERTRDSGIELGAGCINVRVHHNVLRTTHGGLRYKLPRVGPVFIYCNVLIDGAPFNIWYSMDDSPAEGYVYHNTIIGGSAALMYSSFETPHGIGAPHWHYLNNLVIGTDGFFRNSRTAAPVNFDADYNVVAGDRRPYPNDPAKDAHSRYVDAISVTKDLPPRPLPGSPASEAGLDLSTYLHGKPLPGCEPGYFHGKAPDVGAF